jgi:polyhydroxyalkanoate synthesis regulator phasin
MNSIIKNPDLPVVREELLSKTHFETSDGNDIIRAVYGIKIRDIDPLNDEPIKAVLRYVFTLIGLRSEYIPDEIQKAVIIDFIRKDLKNYGIEEIPIAFRKAIKGELGIDANHFQSFSPLYLAGIMNAYSAERRIALKNYLRKIEEEESNKPIKMSEEEKKEIHESWIRDGILKPYLFYLKKGTLTFGITPWGIVYRTLEEDLKLLSLTPDEKREIWEEAKRVISEDIEKNKTAKNLSEYREIQKIKELIEKDGLEVTLKKDIVSKCHELSIRRFFDSAKRTGRNLEEEIETYLTNYKNNS